MNALAGTQIPLLTKLRKTAGLLILLNKNELGAPGTAEDIAALLLRAASEIERLSIERDVTCVNTLTSIAK